MNSGYRGRKGIYELMTVDEEMRRIILEQRSADELRARAKKTGMKTLREMGIEKVKEGLTTPEEVLRAIPQTAIDGVYRDRDFRQWAGHTVALSSSLTVTGGMIHPLIVQLAPPAKERAVMGILALLISGDQPVEKRWQLIMNHLSAILARASYNFLRPYLGDRRIFNGNYELGQFFEERERHATFLFADLRNFTAVTVPP